ESEDIQARLAQRPVSSLEQKLANRKREKQLWVDKYSPKAFNELLSDDRTNREVLRWLKAWDPAVFGAPALSSTAFGATARGKFLTQKYGDLRASKFSASGVGLDPDGRPQEKIILLFGPPGAGKTTLAHVVAAHCGYRVNEVNASDDRSGGALKQRILDAISFQPVMGDKRPNCVVLDEIDGALGGAEGKGGIDFLVKLASTESDSTGEVAKDGKGKGKGKGKPARLMRPIICICNDMYTPALRPLRDIAHVFYFNAPPAGHLYKRLAQVCKKENIAVEGRALGTLVAKTNCDIRSCLHTLQLLSRSDKKLTTNDLSGSNIGQKDINVQAHQVWKSMFSVQKKTPFQQAVANASTSAATGARGAEQQGQREWQEGLKLVSSLGDDDLLLNGMHHNLHHVRFHDVHLVKTTRSLDWIGCSDLMQSKVRSGMNFALQGYVSMAALAVRRMASVPGNVDVEWPVEGARVRRDTAAIANMLDGWRASVVPKARQASLASRNVVVLDVLARLMTILTPPLRPVAPQLLNMNERKDLSGLVGNLLAYGLAFSTHSGHSSQQQGGGARDGELGLIPAIDAANSYPQMTTQMPRRVMGPVIKQLVTHEQQLESIRRAAGGEASQAMHDASEEDRSAAVLQEQKERAADLIKKYQDLEKDKIAQGTKAANVRGHKMPVLYKYHEGFTNAVKRNILIRDLLA
ncbi:hypothetical protein CYMTET_32611, partial [Cymbomonas tetramitiformis]